MFFPYAETHYKFRLPWSPLHKPWPEIFLDAPHQVLPGKPFSLYLLVKDADLYPVIIRSITIRIEDAAGKSAEQKIDLNLHCDTNVISQSFPLTRDGLEGSLRISGWITAENRRGKSICFLCHNFPGIEQKPLEIRLLNHLFPYPSNWFAGEMHCHSEFSSDPVEFGAPLRCMQEAADAVGLDFVLCTDHSYDFYYRRENFLKSIDPEKNFAEYQTQALSLNAERPNLPTMVPGEEVSCGNSHGENVHLLTFGHDRFLPGLGDGGRRRFKNRPDLSIDQTLQRLHGTPSFAAHPKAKIGWLERKIFRRGEWRDEDLNSDSVRGLQFWNGNLGTDYRDGKAFWIAQLLKGRRLLPIAANDAHGDFNQNIGVKFPLISLHQGRSHLFGKVRTVVPAQDKSISSLRTAFLGDTCVCSDGPFISLSRHDDQIRIDARSNPDFGTLQSIHVYSDRIGDATEKLLKEWNFTEGPLDLEDVFPTPSSSYVRAEIVTRNGNRALCSALFLD